MPDEEERERVRSVNRSLLNDVMKCPDFDIRVFEDEIERWKKREKLRKRLHKFLDSQDFENENNEEIANKLFDYIEGNNWFDMDSVESPRLMEITT